ncbi:MAG TPA: tetratricopeptide repeat protein [Gemmatimonadales bacterium]|nr:tetratricopeptide repeat protein [Gemmatimonadales bacterium]
MRRPPALLGLLVMVALGGCASKGDLRELQEEVLLGRQENQRADSARAHQLAEVIANQRQISDSLAALQNHLGLIGTQMTMFKGDVANDLISVQQQLVQVQALTGQSQQRLTELQTQLDARSEQLNAAPPAVADTGAAAAPSGAGGAPGLIAVAPNAPSADQMYAASLQQLRRGSPATARLGFREMLRTYPTNPRAPDATYFVGETFAAESPDSAAIYYAKVVESFPQSPRAASSLYKLGLLAERRKDLEGARGYYQRVLKDYPRSDEAALARDRLQTLGR